MPHPCNRLTLREEKDKEYYNFRTAYYRYAKASVRFAYVLFDWVNQYFAPLAKSIKNRP